MKPTPTSLSSPAQEQQALSTDRLLELVYDELRKLAYSKISRESANLTLQATALVHEAWIRIGADTPKIWDNRAHFLSAAAEAMRRILIERARRRLAVKHGGEYKRVDMEDIDGLPETMNDDEHMIDLEEALSKFAIENPKKAELVKLRYFIGLTVEEAADALEISAPTAKRWWAYARAWLYHEIEEN